jgi:hypothetical protein
MSGLQTKLKDLGASFQAFKAKMQSDVRREDRIAELRTEFLKLGAPPHMAEILAQEKYRLIRKNDPK